MTQCDYLFKFIVIGDSGVGKSCTVLQFIQQKINLNQDSTIGVQFASKNMKINKKLIKLQIWDTAGQENFRSITRSYYRSAIGALLVYDITRETFQHLQQWMQQVKSHGNAQLEILLVGNKTDLQSLRQVRYQQGKQFAKKQGINFIQMSAQQYKKVQKAFTTLTQNILIKIDRGQISETTMGVKFYNDRKNIIQKNNASLKNNEDKKVGCC